MRGGGRVRWGRCGSARRGGACVRRAGIRRQALVDRSGYFHAFADEAGRQAHLNGQIAAALMANAAALFSTPPVIEKIDLLAAKLPG